jgi:hypothetical protein
MTRSAADRLAICLELFDDIIAIRVTAARFAKLDTATQPAARLVGEVLEKEGIHRALEADMQMRDLTFGQGNVFCVGVSHSLEQASDVFLVAL